MSNLTPSEIAVSLPFTIDASGKVVSTTNTDKIWMDRVASLIGTNLGERLMKPTFGTKLSTIAFSNSNEIPEIVDRELGLTFSVFFPQLAYIDSTIDFNDIEGTVNITIQFLTPNKQQISTNVGIVGISGNKLLSEESL